MSTTHLGSIQQAGGNVTAPQFNLTDAASGVQAAIIYNGNTTNPGAGFARGVIGGTAAQGTWDVRGHSGGLPVLIAKAPVKSYTITNRSRTSNAATVTLSGTHGFIATEQVQITGVSDATFNTSSSSILSVTATTITYANTGSNVSSTASTGMATVVMSANLQEWVNGNNVAQATMSNTGVITANGSGLTNLNATNLSSGTVPAARMPALTGDVTTTAGAVATTIASNAVSNAKFRQSAALAVVGNSTNGTANVADIAAANDGEVLRRSGTALGFGTVATAGIGNNQVTDAKLRQSAGLSVVGNGGNSTANVADITAAADGQVLRRSGTAIAFGAVDLASAFATTGTLPTTRLPVATASDMEAQNPTMVVAPNVQQRHPGHPKAWAYVTVSGTSPSLLTGYGVASVAYGGGTGAYTVNWSTAFSSASYCVQVTCTHKGGSGNVIANVNGLSTTQLALIFTINSTTLTDPTGFFVTAFGDQ